MLQNRYSPAVGSQSASNFSFSAQLQQSGTSRYAGPPTHTQPIPASHGYHYGPGAPQIAPPSGLGGPGGGGAQSMAAMRYQLTQSQTQPNYLQPQQQAPSSYGQSQPYQPYPYQQPQFTQQRQPSSALPISASTYTQQTRDPRMKR